jgi:hypothetical protein
MPTAELSSIAVTSIKNVPAESGTAATDMIWVESLMVITALLSTPEITWAV